MKSRFGSSKKRIMLVCASGMVSSTLIFPQIEDILNESGYSFTLIKGTFSEIKYIHDLDLILTTVSPLPPEVQELGIPVVVVTSLFRGDRDEIREKILSELKKIDN